MNNLFKKGFASLALASAMTSSIFGGNAHSIDIGINYLSGSDNAVLGYESNDNGFFKTGARKDLVELYIRVLDADGEFADKDAEGNGLTAIRLTGNGNKVGYFNDGLIDVNETVTNVVHRGLTASSSIATKAIANKNAARYTLDYTDETKPTLVDLLMVEGGKLSRNITINLTSLKAKGLIVRATTKDQLAATGGIINNSFSKIKADGAAKNLDSNTTEVPQILAGETVPLRIYASSLLDNPASGKFTVAPNLEGKTIVVVALGDYSANGKTSAYIGSTPLEGDDRLIMKNGVASGKITINHGMPDKLTGTTVTGSEAFGSTSVGGLGVAFVAYVLDTPTISSIGMPVVLSNGAYRLTDGNLIVDGNSSSTDSLKVRSGYASGYKVGTFNSNAKMASKFFTDKSYVFVGNTRGLQGAKSTLADENISITAVDKLGNPGSLGIVIAAGTDAGINLPTSIKIGDKSVKIGEGTKDINITANGDATGDAGFNMFTNGTTGISTGILQVSDWNSTIATTKKVLISYGGVLAGLAPAKITVSTVDVVGNTPDDIVGKLKDSDIIETISVSNEGAPGSVIFTEQSKEADYANMVVHVKVDKATMDGNMTLLVKVNKVADGAFNSAIIAHSYLGGAIIAASDSTTNPKWWTVDINSSADSIFLSTSAITAGGTLAGNISIISFNVTDKNASWVKAIGSTTKITLKGSQIDTTGAQSHLQHVDAYVQTTVSTKGAEDFVDKTTESAKPGDVVVDFDFKGTFVTQNVGNTVAKITFIGEDYGTQEANDSIKVGLVGKPFSSVSTIAGSANTNVITTPIPADGRISVSLYGVYASVLDQNKDSNTTKYNIKSIEINEFVPVYTSRHKNELSTPKAIDIDMNQEKNITVEAGDKKSAAKVSIRGIGTTSEGNGKDGDSADALPNSGADELLKNLNGTAFSNPSSNELLTDSKVKISTNKFYTLFDDDNDLRITDLYGNEANMESKKIADNYTLTTSNPECASVKMNGGSSGSDPATIKFEDCAADSTDPISLIITAKGNEKAFNKITFTNIIKNVENTKFLVTLSVGAENYNVANNDIIVKVVGDGNTPREDTTLTVASKNKDASIVIMPVTLLGGKPFGTIVPSGSTITQEVSATGNYYVIRSDKTGDVTVTASATIPKDEAKAKVDTPIVGSVTFKVAVMDTKAPTATATGNVVTVSDANLDTKKTTVKIYDITGKFVSDAKMGASGVYTAAISSGTYTARVDAVDLAGNMHNITLVLSSGTQATLESLLVGNGSYVVDGKFVSYDFEDTDAAFDWAYVKDDTVYQLNSKEPIGNSAFKWGKVDKVTPKDVGDTNAWSMIRLTGSAGSADNADSYGWVLVNANGDTFKLAGANEDGTFKFSDPLYVKATISGGNVSFAKR